MGLSTAERNRRKRERKKRERAEERNKKEEEEPEVDEETNDDDDDVEIEYVAEAPLMPLDAFEAVRRLQEEASAAVITDDERKQAKNKNDAYDRDDFDEDDEDEVHEISKRKLREQLRPSVAELKRRVARPDLVEAHDITAADPEFLIELKAVPGTVPVPRHWGRKRKYLQGKKGFEKPPFQLPDFIVKTGITDLRDTVAAEENSMSAKQKNRTRVAPKMGAIDVDYRTLHDAFFKHQTKPTKLTKFGDLYYEGRELEISTKVKVGAPLSRALREALGMMNETAPPPWLVNMQRYGPPPSYPNLRIPGLNAPLPMPECQYGFHPGGWGKPPVDAYGRPLYGGNPFDPPGSKAEKQMVDSGLVTSDGKAIAKDAWGALPSGDFGNEEDSEEELSDVEMEESDAEDDADEERTVGGADSVLPPPSGISGGSAPVDLRKHAGDETPIEQVKQLYKVIEQRQASSDQQEGAIFASEVVYDVTGEQTKAALVPEGAESVLSKALPTKSKAKMDDDDEEELSKNFKF